MWVFYLFFLKFFLFKKKKNIIIFDLNMVLKDSPNAKHNSSIMFSMILASLKTELIKRNVKTCQFHVWTSWVLIPGKALKVIK